MISWSDFLFRNLSNWNAQLWKSSTNTMSGHCNVRINNRLGLYDEGRALPQMYWEQILNLHHDGPTQQKIADTVRISVGYVRLRNKQHFSARFYVKVNRPTSKLSSAPTIFFSRKKVSHHKSQDLSV